ncbi:DEAD/DEAH box helicase family protein [Cecembia calidifontis]|jgi:hypothetical protein|uniref:Type III restriction/modification enzyme restriction subunit n=1 Tax=Cecembia calidifontis TaxID=1187080 RepID=A0A4Q7PA85_9BACT|nr:DEAD/DEAH box helicase family protein [Cecembia calidifontis]RZS97163.1 type III restriction/modification enzyme restriction subunit [Cecembia calidifontis]
MAKRNKNTIVKLSKALVLNRWVLSQFGVIDLESLADAEFKRSVYEGLDADNTTHYHHYLLSRQFTFPGVSKTQLVAWDQNIVSHTLRISEHRDAPIKWKYFQYLGLLFVELYLEKYFSNKFGLLEELNEFVDKYNNPLDTSVPIESGFVVEAFTLQELNKLAFWNATGSGKTLLMHVNILQYQHYLKLYGEKKQINKVLLVTPNEGLSQQHLREFEESGIEAEIFTKRAGGLFSGSKVEILEISKLAEESGDKTVAIEAFETNNLVLIDEGHRGVAGDQWKERRDYLSRTGFAFEYSATFGQAVSAASGPKKLSLTQEYSKTILMDYSYKYFYSDGYGKDYNILNVPDNSKWEFTRKYLTGALLSFYQQMLIFEENPHWAIQFQLQKPLWVFVGGSVNAVRTVEKKETSDVLDIIHFYNDFIKDPLISRQHIQEFLSGRDGIKDDKNRDVFAGRFNYLIKTGQQAEAIYLDILGKVFQTETVGANIYVDQLKGQDGELGLRVGEKYFGVINVGDDAKLFKLCQDNKIPGESKDFTSSLFHSINSKNSDINVLIGSKKFTEGWSSWRVSTMGLMNIGRSEGSQIIQLFGRGVRLKGYQMSLKRSDRLDQDQRPETKIPKEIKPLETLQIFGIRADYMQQFKEFLEEEGLPANDSNFVTVEVPTMIETNLGTIKLKVLQVHGDTDFKKDVVVDLAYDSNVGNNRVRLEWYPKVQMMTGGRAISYALPTIESQKLDEKHLAFVDWNTVFFRIQQFKNERSWYNLNISLEELKKIIQQKDWYELVIPSGELEPNTFRKVQEWQEIIIALLKGYVDRFYNMVKSGYLSEHMETMELTPDHPNFLEAYKVEIEQSREDIIEKITKINQLLKSAAAFGEQEVVPDFSFVDFVRHLYKPLVYIDSKKYRDLVRISPVALNKGEYQFVKDLKHFYEKHPEIFEGKQLYLLRNSSRKGIGFFEANGFYPDFILWLVEKNHQFISFIDPKGLRNIGGLDHPKIKFHKTTKDKIEAKVKLSDPEVTLNSFIVSPTRHAEVRHWSGGERIQDFNKHHVFFMEEQRDDYIRMLMEKIT